MRLSRRPLSHKTSAAVGVAGAFGLLVGLALLWSHSRHVSAQEVPEASECTLQLGKTAAPNVLRLGESATVTLAAVGDCPDRQAPGHVVLVIDRSLSMVGSDKLASEIQAAKHFVDVLDLTTSKVGVVAFAADPEVMIELTTDLSAAHDAIDAIEIRPSSNIGAAIEGAREMLERGRTSGLTPTVEALVLMSDGSSNAPRPDPAAAALAAADRAKADGIQIATACLGVDCDKETMRQAASHDDLFLVIPDLDSLLAWMEHLAVALLQPAIRAVTITDTLPPNMGYEDGSAAPSPIAAGNDWLSWTWHTVPPSGVTASLRIEPQEMGHWPTNVLAEAIFTDTLGQSGSDQFPVPEVDVMAPPPTPVSTPTLSPTSTATQPATKPPTPTDDPSTLARAAYLPFVRGLSVPISGPANAVAAAGEWAYFGSGSSLVVAHVESLTELRAVGSTGSIEINTTEGSFQCEPIDIMAGDSAGASDRPRFVYALCSDPTAGMDRPYIKSAMVTVDVGDPESPVVTAILPLRELTLAGAISGRWAYIGGSTCEEVWPVCGHAFEGLIVVDLEDPARPVRHGTLDLGVSPLDMIVDGETLVIGGVTGGLPPTRATTAVLQINDITHPNAPVFLGSTALDDAFIQVSSVAQIDDLAYATRGLSWAEISVANVHDPRLPQRLGVIAMQSLMEQVQFARAGAGHLIVLGSAVPDDPPIVEALQVLAPVDPAAGGPIDPLPVGHVVLGERMQIWSFGQPLSVSGNRVYVAHGEEGGLTAVDISDIGKPQVIGRLLPTQ